MYYDIYGGLYTMEVRKFSERCSVFLVFWVDIVDCGRYIGMIFLLGDL